MGTSNRGMESEVGTWNDNPDYWVSVGDWKFTQPVTLITGITGQDGSYLADHLLKQDYKVIGVARRCSHPSGDRIRHITSENFVLEEADVSDYHSMLHLIEKYKPQYIYNLAAQSHVGTSFKQPDYTTEVTYKGLMNILEAVRFSSPSSKVYQASSSEMFGDQFSGGYSDTPNSFVEPFQDENTKMNPQSPYSIAKLAAYNLGRLYRKSYGLFVCNGILFNHESPRRGDNFLTKKVTKYVADLYWVANKKTFPKLKLGNLDACRDWGYAPDYVDAMQRILEHTNADDFVIGTGETYSVQDFVDTAFREIGENWLHWVEQDPSLMRPSEVPYLRARPQKALIELGWKPKTSFKDLVKIMVQYDINDYPRH